jgi:gas vesicle protein
MKRIFKGGNNMSENNSKFQTLAAFMLGLGLGAVAGILLAPASGEETRKKVGKWARDTAEKAKESLGDLEEKVEEKLEKI